MPKKNYSKEIAEFQKRIDELKLEEANEKLAPVIKAISDEILRNQDAVLALTPLSKDGAKAVGHALSNYVVQAVNDAEPELKRIRDRKAKQSAARQARREKNAVVTEEESEENSADTYADNVPPQQMNNGTTQWNRQ